MKCIFIAFNLIKYKLIRSTAEISYLLLGIIQLKCYKGIMKRRIFSGKGNFLSVRNIYEFVENYISAILMQIRLRTVQIKFLPHFKMTLFCTKFESMSLIL